MSNFVLNLHGLKNWFYFPTGDSLMTKFILEFQWDLEKCSNTEWPIQQTNRELLWISLCKKQCFVKKLIQKIFSTKS